MQKVTFKLPYNHYCFMYSIDHNAMFDNTEPGNLFHVSS